MNFEALKARVERAEALTEGRMLQTQDHYQALRGTWRQAWTPTRILIAGLASGFLVGRSHPERTLEKLRVLGGPKWIQLISSASGLVASLQASFAATTAASAADTADDAAQTADAAAEHAIDAAKTAGVSPDRVTVDHPAAGTGGGHGTRPSDARRRPEPAWDPDAPPIPAEAATDLSER